VKLPSIPSRDDLTAQARNLAGQAASGAAKAADTVSRAAVDTGRAAARTAAQTSQRLGVDQLPGLSTLSQLAQDDGASGDADADAGPRITGTPFARTLATAFAAQPHTRSATTIFFGSDILRTGPQVITTYRTRKQLKNNGFAPEALNANGLPELDVTELIHVHGRRIPGIKRSLSLPFIKHDVRRTFDTALAVGSLHWITVSEQEQARGAMGWTRLCVDTDQSQQVSAGGHHLDVVIASVSQDPSEYASDMASLLPQGIPAEAWQALTADPARQAVRLHLLEQDRVAVDTGANTYTLFHGVPHPMLGSLLLMGNRVRRAELWLTDRHNTTIMSFIEEIADFNA